MSKNTLAEENYIKTIYHLQKEKEMVNTNELAEIIRTKPASVTDMLKKLKKKKLVNYKAYYGCRLTHEGEKASLMVIRRHRLWEYFLSEKLGFSWDEVHEVAEELEHIKSEKLINKLEVFLGYPHFDPHGDPIPDIEGNIASDNAITLSEIEQNKPVIVIRIGKQSSDILELLQHKNISLGSVIKVKQKHVFDHSLEIDADKKKNIHISNELAKNILVKDYEEK
jgi:DtxR family transcriptional regulator, Mn-dependent transcriptional regulator